MGIEDRIAPAVRRRIPRTATSRDLLAKLGEIEQRLARLERSAGTERGLPPITDKRFLAVQKEVKSHRRTLLNRNRLWTLWQAVRNVAPLDGAAAEVGAYRGGSAHFIAAAFVEIAGHEVPLEVIDTFEGHPPGTLSEHDSPAHGDPTKFKDTSHQTVVEYLSPFRLTTVHKGEFSAVAARLQERRYRLVHLDVDLFEPTLDCLRYFGPRLVDGGILVLDDYDKLTCPGIRRAAETYLAEDAAFQVWSTRTSQLVLVRTRPAGRSL
jgi:O-methyltransferase